MLRWLGVPAAVGAVVCVALWRLESVSTWCAFAAVCSVILLVRSCPYPATGSVHGLPFGSDRIRHLGARARHDPDARP
ncbi:DUF6629 family protein [Streptomyces sp. NPDC127117]|uniref:DUF6629 family protein n=1 Tax=Streptomyces sp. NPDC127117 TaxID=3345368 RepID=UPI00363ADEA1